MRPANWRDDAACLDADPDLFFPVGTTGPALLQVDQAKRICRGCPARTPCLAWALDQGIGAGIGEVPQRKSGAPCAEPGIRRRPAGQAAEGAFEGNMAETGTMLPVIEAFMTDCRLPDVTVVADAGMISEANQKAIEAAGLSFIPRMRIPNVPMWSPSGTASTPASRSPTGTSLPSHGRPG